MKKEYNFQLNHKFLYYLRIIEYKINNIKQNMT